MVFLQGGMTMLYTAVTMVTVYVILIMTVRMDQMRGAV